MRQTSSPTHTKKPLPPVETNGHTVDPEVLFHTRTMVGILWDISRQQAGIRHGLDTIPEKVVRLIQHQAPSRPASKLKEWALFLKVLFPWVIFGTGIVASIFKPSTLPGLVQIVLHSVMPQ